MLGRAGHGDAATDFNGDAVLVYANDQTSGGSPGRKSGDGLIVLDVARLEDVGRADLVRGGGGIVKEEHAASDVDERLAICPLILDGLLRAARCGQASRFLAGDCVAVGVQGDESPW